MHLRKVDTQLVEQIGCRGQMCAGSAAVRPGLRRAADGESARHREGRQPLPVGGWRLLRRVPVPRVPPHGARGAAASRSSARARLRKSRRRSARQPRAGVNFEGSVPGCINQSNVSLYFVLFSFSFSFSALLTPKTNVLFQRRHKSISASFSPLPKMKTRERVFSRRAVGRLRSGPCVQRTLDLRDARIEFPEQLERVGHVRGVPHSRLMSGCMPGFSPGQQLTE